MKETMIKCFKTLKNYYFYDRYMNAIVKVNEIEYRALKEIEAGRIDSRKEECLDKYRENGLLHEKVTKIIRHPATDDIEYCTAKKVQQLILQVTQQCNLRCSYCIYSGNYYNRGHSSQRMLIETAKDAIDFYLEHSYDADDITVSFYGGEPLLEFETIKKCVEYLEDKTRDKYINFHMTTNGTLLNEKVMRFLIDHNFHLMISLDGDKNEHDINRKFRNGEGSFNYIMINLHKLYLMDKDYFSRIKFNVVLNPKVDIKNVFDFFIKSPLINLHQVNLSVVADAGIVDRSMIKADENFWIPYRYEQIKVYLFMLGKISKKDINPLFANLEQSILDTLKILKSHNEEGIETHHAGPCLAGVHRLFVDVDGNLFPCERVSENVDKCKIGSLSEGFNCEKICDIVNIGKLTQEECLECWNLRMCKLCIGEIDFSNDVITRDDKLKLCTKKKHDSIEVLQTLCALIENGYEV